MEKHFLENNPKYPQSLRLKNTYRANGVDVRSANSYFS